MKRAVLFDLGGTLVRYYSRGEFPTLLEQAALLHLPGEEVRRRAGEENQEASDFRVRPLEERLARIFRLGESETSGERLEALCRCFMRPILTLARRYDDTLPNLRRLRTEGYRVAIVSNTSWGSPAWLWREEIARHGLAEWIDATVFCRDVGWRKPAPQIFTFALEQVEARPEESLFVGDDYRWDVAGPRAVGIEAVLIDRGGTAGDTAERAIHGLDELWARLC